MRDEIRQIVIQAIAGTKDLTEAIDELCVLSSVIYYVSEEFECNNNTEYCGAFRTKLEAEKLAEELNSTIDGNENPYKVYADKL